MILIIKYLNTEKLELKKRLCFDNAKKEIEKNKKLWTREKIEIKSRLEGLIIGMEWEFGRKIRKLQTYNYLYYYLWRFDLEEIRKIICIGGHLKYDV